jgi:hypothetical protein
MWNFKMHSRNTKTTNEPTASNNKSDRPQVNIWDTWNTLTYLNINDSFHLKNLEINKAYYQESYILIIEYSSVVTVAEWLDGSF